MRVSVADCERCEPRAETAVRGRSLAFFNVFGRAV
jgi:hypothetical protein